jgi:hypothetical protein
MPLSQEAWTDFKQSLASNVSPESTPLPLNQVRINTPFTALEMNFVLDFLKTDQSANLKVGLQLSKLCGFLHVKFDRADFVASCDENIGAKTAERKPHPAPTLKKLHHQERRAHNWG